MSAPCSLRFRTLVALLLLPAALAADEAPSSATSVALTVEDAIVRALEKNYTVRVREIEPQATFHDYRSARGIFDPRLETSFRFSEDDSPQSIDPFSETPEAFTIRQDEVSAGIAGLLPWGTTYRFGLDAINRRGTYNDFANEVNTLAGVSISQPLLRGFGRAATSTEIRVARATHRQAQWLFEEAVMDTLVDVVAACNDVAFSERNLEVAHRNRDLARKTLADNRRRVTSGAMAPLDLVVAEAELALREERVLGAEFLLEVQRNRLRLLTSDRIEGLVSEPVDLAPMPEPAAPELQLEHDFTTALENRPDYRQALIDLEIRAHLLDRERKRALPRLDITARYGLRGLDSSLAGSIGELGGSDTDSLSIGATFSYPIGNNTGTHARTAASLRLTQSERALESLRQAIYINLANAGHRVRTDWKRIAATRHARELAARSLEAEEKKLRAGTTTTFVVLRLQQDLADAEVRELQAISDYNQSVAAHRRETGEILQRYGIVLSSQQ